MGRQIVAGCVTIVFMCVTFVVLKLPAYNTQHDFVKTAIRSDASATAIRSDASANEHLWKWEDVYSYVPNGIQSCTDLFQDKRLPEDFQNTYTTFLKEVDKHKVTEGFSAMHPEKLLFHIKAVQAPFIKTVCETGFNGGHSSFTWLSANPQVHVYAFDIGTHAYAKSMAKYLKEEFPGRLNVTWGNSLNTLPEFHKKNSHIKCDLIIIDGGHTYQICKSDYDAFRGMANENNIVILDDYPRGVWMKELGDVWETGKRNGEIAEVFTCRFPKNVHGFAVGRFIIK